MASFDTSSGNWAITERILDGMKEETRRRYSKMLDEELTLEESARLSEEMIQEHHTCPNCGEDF